MATIPREAARHAARAREAVADERACTYANTCPGCQRVSDGEKSYAYHYGVLASRVEMLLAALEEAAR